MNKRILSFLVILMFVKLFVSINLFKHIPSWLSSKSIRLVNHKSRVQIHLIPSFMFTEQSNIILVPALMSRKFTGVFDIYFLCIILYLIISLFSADLRNNCKAYWSINRKRTSELENKWISLRIWGNSLIIINNHICCWTVVLFDILLGI